MKTVDIHNYLLTLSLSYSQKHFGTIYAISNPVHRMLFQLSLNFIDPKYTSQLCDNKVQCKYKIQVP